MNLSVGLVRESRAMQTLSISSLIGFKAYSRPFESFHMYVSRILYANFLTEEEIRNYMPVPWLQLAFAPQNATTELVDAVTNGYPNLPSLIVEKAMSATWEIFPALESHPNEYMRFCPACFNDGYHSYAYQSTLLKECPIHRVALTNRCPQCETPVPWKSHLLHSKSALRCPRGCDLSRRYLNGLLDTPRGLTHTLGMHLEWTHQVKKIIRFELGPVYMVYPPRQQLGGIIPYRPSAGLTAAFCDILRRCTSNSPAFLPFHDVSHGEWEFQLERWISHGAAGSKRKEHRDAMARTIQRGPYTTELPLPTCAHQLVALNALAIREKDYRIRRIHQRDRWLLAIPSHLITNSEVAALYQILSSADDDTSVDVFYGQLLVELLERAYERRRAFDAKQNPECLDIAERIEGLVRIGDKTFRVAGKTKTAVFGREAWDSFTEQTSPRAGIVLFATARGLWA